MNEKNHIGLNINFILLHDILYVTIHIMYSFKEGMFQNMKAKSQPQPYAWI